MSNIRRWLNFCQRIGAEGDVEGTYSFVVQKYCEPERAYHNMDHIRHCLEEFDEARSLARIPNELEMALWFHDVIYDPRAADNEEKSAILARRLVEKMGLSRVFSLRVGAYILLTKHHVSVEGMDVDSRLVIDIDLSILGTSTDAFNKYEREIRQEYSWVPEEQFRSARAGILRDFLERPTIYSTDHFWEKYENAARENLRRSLASLT